MKINFKVNTPSNISPKLFATTLKPKSDAISCRYKSPDEILGYMNN